MADIEESNERTASTTWVWRQVKLSQPPQANGTTSEARPPKGSLLHWPRGKPMTIVIKYRGGPEGWVEVRARGRVWRRPGTTALYDLIVTLFGYPPK